MIVNEIALFMMAAQARTVPVYHDPRFPPSLYYRFFWLLAMYHKPRLSIELGLCGGGGSLHLALGHPDGTVVGIDLIDDHPDNLAHIKENFHNFHYWQGDSVKDAAEISHRYGKVDILFIDTIHTLEQTIDEWDAWLPYLSRRAIVCLDDLYRPGMEEAWAQMPDPKLRLDCLHCGTPGVGGGFGVVWQP
jgi:predicted O-methyltransferase YrrM